MSFVYAGQWGPDSITTPGGTPLRGLSVTINVHGGGLATLYTDRTKAVHAPNPLTVDNEGNLTFFADPGDYDIVGNGATLTVSLSADPSEPVTATNAVTQPPLTDNTLIATTAYTDAAVGVETTRAETAEATNATAITAETTRATTAEAGKQAGPLTGDVTTSGAAATLAAVGSAGTTGDATHVSQITTDTKGRVTGATNVAITGLAESAITNLVSDLAGKQAGPLTGDVTTSGAAATLKNTGPGATGPIGDATHVATVTIDAQGRVTALTSTAITAGGSGTVTSASVVTANGFAGSVATATTTPAITISTTVTGILKGNGTAVSAAAAADIPTVGAGSTGPLSATDASVTNSRAPNGSASGDLAGSYPSPTLAAAGPGATGPIGSATVTPVITIDAKGRVTGLTSANIQNPFDILVAASNSTAAAKASADYTCTGTADQTTINTALTAAATGRVVLAEGTYNLTASIIMPANTSLFGQGSGTIINVGYSLQTVTTQTATWTGTSNPVTLSGSNANIQAGQLVTGTNIPINTIVTTCAGTALTLSNNPSGAGTGVTLTFQAYGVYPAIDIYDQSSNGAVATSGCLVADLKVQYTGTTGVMGVPLTGLPGGARGQAGRSLACAVYINGDHNYVENVQPNGLMIGVLVDTWNRFFTNHVTAGTDAVVQNGAVIINSPTLYAVATVGDSVRVTGSGQYTTNNYQVAYISALLAQRVAAAADVTIANGSPTFTSAATLQFTQQDVGRVISGTNIPSNTTILSVQSATQATMSANASGTSSGNYTIANSLLVDIAATAGVAAANCWLVPSTPGLGRAYANWIKNLDCVNMWCGVVGGWTEALHVDGVRGNFNESVMANDAVGQTTGSAPAHAVYLDGAFGNDHIDLYLSDIHMSAGSTIGTTAKLANILGSRISGMTARDTSGVLSNDGAIKAMQAENLQSHRSLGNGISFSAQTGYQRECSFSNVWIDLASTNTTVIPNMSGVHDRYQNILVTTSWTAAQTKAPLQFGGSYCAVEGVLVYHRNQPGYGVDFLASGGHAVSNVVGYNVTRLLNANSAVTIDNHVSYDPQATVMSGGWTGGSTGNAMVNYNGSATGLLRIDKKTSTLLVTQSGGGTINPDIGAATTIIISVTDATNFTLGVPGPGGLGSGTPVNTLPGTRQRFIIRNDSGGAMGTVSFSSNWVLSTPFVSPPSGGYVVVEFECDGTATVAGKWKQLDRAIGGYVSTSTASLPATTLYTTIVQNLTGSTANGTLTIGTTSFVTGQLQYVYNNSSVSVTLAAASGSIDTTQLPAAAGIVLRFDGTNWNTVAGTGLRSNSSGVFALSTPAPTTGSAFTPLSTSDCLLSIKCTTAATYTLTTGPSTGAENSLMTPGTGVIGVQVQYRIPKNWKVIFTGTVADFAFQAQAV